MKKRVVFPIAAVLMLWAWNSSLIAGIKPNPSVKLLSHRGVHQTYHRANLKNDTCTAIRIDPVTHHLIENTPESTSAAFDAGADVVEIDIHLTPDQKFAVFHDWTLDCRTDGAGITHDQPMEKLKTLDIGYGYSSDGGETYPLRGKYENGIPELTEFLSAFPNRKFLINFKSNDIKEGHALANLISAKPEIENQIFGVYGAAKPTNAVLEKFPAMLGFTKSKTKACLIQYLAIGWSGYIPSDCRNGYISVPTNYAWAIWGWPNRFQRRMEEVGTKIILLGPMDLSAPGTVGIDTLKQTELVPAGFDGYVWTNKIEIVGGHFKSKN